MTRTRLNVLPVLLATGALLAFGGAPVSAQELRPASPDVVLGLKDISSLDLARFNAPITSDQTPGADIPMWIQRSLSNNSVLPYKSPSDAALSLHCEGFECRKIVAEISLQSQGGAPNAPVLWRHEESVFKYKWLTYYKRESEDIANAIVQSLLADYAQAQSGHFKTVSQNSQAPSQGDMFPLTQDLQNEGMDTHDMILQDSAPRIEPQ
ncbi:MAG: hypothetical protein VKJ04_07045 [Vampirovibrionales bacterium]|nr:hypothetical protein [Vampirovibrionales bacterium]